MAGPQPKAFGQRKSTQGIKAAPSPERPTDKRVEERNPTFKNAVIFISGGVELECIARNVSKQGCRVSVIGAENLPDDLTIRLDAVTGTKIAKVAWREKGEAGLSFVSTEDTVEHQA